MNRIKRAAKHANRRIRLLHRRIIAFLPPQIGFAANKAAYYADARQTRPGHRQAKLCQQNFLQK
jgi:hypothetical protein